MKRVRPYLLVGVAAGLVAIAASAQASSPAAAIVGTTTAMRDALSAEQQIEAPWVDPATVKRAKVPTDIYSLASGCYVIHDLDNGHYIQRANGTFAATADSPRRAEPFRMQAYDLGRYLIYGTKHDFLATPTNELQVAANTVVKVVNGLVLGTGDETLNNVREPVLDITKLANEAIKAGGKNVVSQDIVDADSPSEAAEWIVTKLGDGFQIGAQVDDGDEGDPGPENAAISGALLAGSDGALHVDSNTVGESSNRFRFELASGCADYPEIGTQVTGPQPVEATSYQATQGYIDAHMHGMAYLFLGGRAHCGRPWHPYGVAAALVDCPDHEPGGKGAVLEDFLSGENPVEGHDTVGWPSFNYWPRYNSLTHEGTYYAWIERAWRSGLRVYTNLFVDNGALCQLYPFKLHDCNEMDTVRLENTAINQMIRYIDAQNGGPGKGWLQVGLDPFQTRAIANAGKLAVIKGIEVSEPFDCYEKLGVPQCTAAQIDKGLDEVYSMGVRQMEITNKFDNALTGVTGDEGTTGELVNTGNLVATGHYWRMSTCESPLGSNAGRTDHLQLNLGDEIGADMSRDTIFGGVLNVFGGMGAAPVYASGPHCNVKGLTDLGKHVIDGMIARGMLFDPDHMSALGRLEAMQYIAAKGYSGVVSSHSWADNPTYQSVIHVGGFVTPYAGSTTSFISAWEKLRKWADPRFPFAIGYGSDINGFGAQGGPRNASKDKAIKYPFKGLGGVTVNKQVSGTRTYDYNVDGTDHYGEYADFVEDARLVAGKDGAAFMKDMTNGVEAYLETWERGVGIKGDACRTDISDLSASAVRQVKTGMSPLQVQALLGQPHTRVAGAYTFCGAGRTVKVSFDRNAKVSKVA